MLRQVVRSPLFWMHEMSFIELFEKYSWDEQERFIDRCDASQVGYVLEKSRRAERLSLDDFAVLLSPEASQYLEEMAQLSAASTRRRFGNTMQLYVPLYLSNECQNICTYCGFSFHNKIPRITLSDEQILREVKEIKRLGFDHVLLVTGEANKTVGLDYFLHALELIKPHFSSVSFEVQPLEEEEYFRLHKAGMQAVLVYQETYHKERYREHHPKGKKSHFDYRLETPDRLGKAGVHKIGLGVLLGLENWRTDSFFTALHLSYLRKRYWKSRYSISFPRLRPAEGVQKPKVEVGDRDLVQLICAYRLFDENLELSLSTRESPAFRDAVLGLGITSMSAGSKTEPGGYACKTEALEQFEISDERSPEQIASLLHQQGFDAVWKDWDPSLQGR